MELLERLSQICDQLDEAGIQDEQGVMSWLAQYVSADAGLVSIVLQERERRATTKHQFAMSTPIGKAAGGRFGRVMAMPSKDRNYVVLAATDGKIAAVASCSGTIGKKTYFLPEFLAFGTKSSLGVTQSGNGRWENSSAKIADEQSSSFPGLSSALADIDTFGQAISIKIDAKRLLRLAEAITQKGYDPVVTLIIDAKDPSKPCAVRGQNGAGAIAVHDNSSECGDMQEYRSYRNLYLEAEAACS